jgi:hypothetical protein
MHGIIINFVLLFYLRFGIYLHLVTANKIWPTYYKQCSALTPIIDQPYTSHVRAPRGGWIGDPVKTWNLIHKTWLRVSTNKPNG